MREDFLINIEGTMEQQGDVDSVQLMTKGSFTFKQGKYYIRYHETQATGYEGNITTVKVEEGGKVSMLRSGSAPSELVIEPGKRHVCHYDSGYGSLSLGVSADEVDSNLSESGGDITFSYTLDSGNSQISYNRVKITVRQTQPQCP